VEREEAGGVGKGERGGDEVGGVPRPVAEEAGVLAGVGLEGDDGSGGHETGKGRGMEAEIGADIPQHGAGTEAGPEGVENLGLVEALVDDETVDVGERIELEDGSVASGKEEGIAERTAGKEAAERDETPPAAAPPDREEPVAKGGCGSQGESWRHGVR
jgi:hypothetical protein